MDFGTAGRLLVFLDSDRRDSAWALLAHLGRADSLPPRLLSGV